MSETDCKVVISGTGLFTPPETITNAELVASFNQYVDLYNAQHAQEIEAGTLEALTYSNEEFIYKASGVENRYVMEKSGVLDPNRLCPHIPNRSDDEPSIQCEIAVQAAQEAMKQANKTAADIDAVIVACSDLQRAYPAIAIEVQNALGIEGYAFDMNVACSSATFGIQQAKDAVLSGSARCVLMVNPEITSGQLPWEDRDCHFIFGDVCTAVIVERADESQSEHQWEILSTRLTTQFSNNIRNNFGYLNRCDESAFTPRDKLFRQNGRKVFKEVVPKVSDIISQHLQDEAISTQDLKCMWLHQANINMNILIAKKVLGRDPHEHEAPVILNEYANTSSAGSIIAFHKHRDRLQTGEMGVICSFGAGYSIGSVLVKKR